MSTDISECRLTRCPECGEPLDPMSERCAECGWDVNQMTLDEGEADETQ